MKKHVITAGTVFACLLFAWSLCDIWIFLYQKISRQSPCPWTSLLLSRELIQYISAEREPSLEDTDGPLGFYRTAEWAFWLPKNGVSHDGGALASLLVAEHRWMEERNPSGSVRAGDVVIDCGAHVGVFTHFALKHGASKVVAVEPAPDNLECLRRNFKQEITAGKVIVVPMAVWNSKTELRFAISTFNSGMNSAVVLSGKQEVSVLADTVDSIVDELGIAKVTYLKMDIEGAERRALSGAKRLLSRDRPRLMIEAYHLPDDYPVLPNIIHQADPRYQLTCICQYDGARRRILPYVFYFQNYR